MNKIGKKELTILLSRLGGTYSISAIEKELEMPKTTLYQVLSKDRFVPKRFRQKLIDFCQKEWVEITLPNGQTTTTNDPILIDYFREKEASQSFVISNENKQTETPGRIITERVIPTNILVKISSMVPQGVLKRDRAAWIENKKQEFLKTGTL